MDEVIITVLILISSDVDDIIQPVRKSHSASLDGS